MSTNEIERRLIRCLWMGLLILLLLPSICFAQERPQAARYKDAQYHFSFLPPAGWTQDREQRPPTLVFLGPSEQNFNVNLSLYSEFTSLTSLDNLIKTTRQEDAKLKGFTLYEEKRTTLAGQPAHTWRVHLNLAGKQPMELRQVFCLHDKRAFSVTLTVPSGSVKKYDAVFEKALASFKWDR